MPFIVHSATKDATERYTADVSYARKVDGKEYRVGTVTFSSVAEFKTVISAALRRMPEAYLSFLLDQHDDGR